MSRQWAVREDRNERSRFMARSLICDDQEMMRDSWAATLVREGHEVVAATDWPLALEKRTERRFELLSTDRKMPKMMGTELLIEAQRLRPEMPVAIMPAFATVAPAVQAMKDEAHDYRQKPFDGDEIKILVDQT